MYDELSEFKLPVKSLSRAKVFYEGLLMDEVIINIKGKTERADRQKRFLGKFFEGLYEEGTQFTPSTIILMLRVKWLKNIERNLKKINELGGKVLYYPKKNEKMPYQALIQDSEGNRIIIFKPPKKTPA